MPETSKNERRLKALRAAVLCFALLGAQSPNVLTVLSSSGAPLVDVRVRLQDRDGHWTVARTDRQGQLHVPDGFHPSRAVVTTANGETSTIALDTDSQTVRLPAQLPIVATVSVATASAQSLHTLPLPASVLTAEQIRKSTGMTTDAVLRALPGFDRNRSNSAFTNYGQLRVSFAGAGNDRGMVLVNGIPAQDGFGGQVDWAAYPYEDLTRAELLRGSGSALYGPTASGGILELRTFAPIAGERGGSASASLGNVTFQQQSFNYETPLSSKSAASLSAARNVSSYSDFPPGSSSPVDYPARSNAVMESFRFRLTPHTGTTLTAGVRDAFDGQDQGRPNYRFARRQVEYDVHAVADAATSSTRIDAYARNNTVINVADKYPAQPGALRYTQNVPVSESGIAATWASQTPTGSLTTRADTRYVRGEVTQFDAIGQFSNSGSGRQRSSGLAVQDAFDWRRGELLASARWDSIGFTDGVLNVGGALRQLSPSNVQAISPRLAVRYDLHPATAIRASVSSGLRAPFLNELLRGFVIGSVTYQPNANLQPERSSTSQIGIDVLQARTHASLDYSLTTVNNAIGFRTIDATHQVRANFERTRSSGATLTFSHQQGCRTLSGWATAQDAVVSAGPAATLGKHLPFVPDSAAYLSLEGSRMGASLSYSGETYADDLNLQPLGKALVGGLYAEVPLSEMTQVRIEADNFFGAVYRSSIDRLAPPAQIQIALQVRRPASNGCTR